MANLMWIICAILYLLSGFACFTSMAWVVGTDSDTDGDAWFAAFFSLFWPVVLAITFPILWWKWVKTAKKERQQRKEQEKQAALERELKAKLDAADRADFRGNT